VYHKLESLNGAQIDLITLGENVIPLLETCETEYCSVFSYTNLCFINLQIIIIIIMIIIIKTTTTWRVVFEKAIFLLINRGY